MADHALLSASGSKKWMTCTPSARLEEQFPDEESEFAKEGTVAHDLLETALSFAYLGVKAEPLTTPEKIIAAGYTVEMAEAVKEFQAHCFAITDPLRAANEPFTVLVEKKLDYEFVLVDLAERVVATYIQSFLGLLLVADAIDIGAVKAALVAAAPAALAVVKGVLAKRLGDPESASVVD